MSKHPCFLIYGVPARACCYWARNLLSFSLLWFLHITCGSTFFLECNSSSLHLHKSLKVHIDLCTWNVTVSCTQKETSCTFNAFLKKIAISNASVVTTISPWVYFSSRWGANVATTSVISKWTACGPFWAGLQRKPLSDMWHGCGNIKLKRAVMAHTKKRDVFSATNPLYLERFQVPTQAWMQYLHAYTFGGVNSFRYPGRCTKINSLSTIPAQVEAEMCSIWVQDHGLSWSLQNLQTNDCINTDIIPVNPKIHATCEVHYLPLWKGFLSFVTISM